MTIGAVVFLVVVGAWCLASLIVWVLDTLGEVGYLVVVLAWMAIMLWLGIQVMEGLI